MIDHTQFEIFCTPDECRRLLEDEELAWQARTTRKGQTWHEGSLLNLKLQLYPLSGTLTVAGSLHAYANDGQHNADDFTRLRLFDTIQHLSERLNFDPARAELRGLEFGVNVEPPQPTREVLNRILTKGKAVPVRFEAEGSDGRRMKYAHYQLKVYDKGRQFRRAGPLLRVEIHVDKMEWVCSQVPGLRTLNDLRRVDVLARLGELLLREWDEVLLAEPFDASAVSARDRATWERLSRVEAWVNLTPEQRRNRKETFRRLVKIGGHGHLLHGEISRLISQKWAYLSDLVTERKPHVLTGMQEQEQTGKTPCFDRLGKLSERGMNPPESTLQNHSNFAENFALENSVSSRTCRTCGADISHRRKTANYCGEDCWPAEVRYQMNRRSLHAQRVREGRRGMLQKLLASKTTNRKPTVAYFDEERLQKEIEQLPTWEVTEGVDEDGNTVLFVKEQDLFFR